MKKIFLLLGLFFLFLFIFKKTCLGASCNLKTKGSSVFVYLSDIDRSREGTKLVAEVKTPTTGLVPHNFCDSATDGVAQVDSNGRAAIKIDFKKFGTDFPEGIYTIGVAQRWNGCVAKESSFIPGAAAFCRNLKAYVYEDESGNKVITPISAAAADKLAPFGCPGDWSKNGGCPEGYKAEIFTQGLDKFCYCIPEASIVEEIIGKFAPFRPEGCGTCLKYDPDCLATHHGPAEQECCVEWSGIQTALGCIHTDIRLFVNWLFKYAISIAGGIAFLMIIFSAFQMITSSGDPEKLEKAKQMLGSAIAGLLFIIFAVFLLRIIGVDILKIF